jgi:hypothetical protein
VTRHSLAPVEPPAEGLDLVLVGYGFTGQALASLILQEGYRKDTCLPDSWRWTRIRLHIASLPGEVPADRQSPILFPRGKKKPDALIWTRPPLPGPGNANPCQVDKWLLEREGWQDIPALLVSTTALFREPVPQRSICRGEQEELFADTFDQISLLRCGGIWGRGRSILSRLVAQHIEGRTVRSVDPNKSIMRIHHADLARLILYSLAWGRQVNGISPENRSQNAILSRVADQLEPEGEWECWFERIGKSMPLPGDLTAASFRRILEPVLEQARQQDKAAASREPDSPSPSDEPVREENFHWLFSDYPRFILHDFSVDT